MPNISVVLSGKGAATCVNGEVLASKTSENVLAQSKIEPIINILKDDNPRQTVPLRAVGAAREGVITGKAFAGYVGGIVSSVDTKWEFRGATKNGKPDTILMLEDIKPPEEMRASIEALHARGILRNVKAVVIGKCGHVVSDKDKENRHGYFGGLDLKNGAGEKIDIAVVPNKVFGHNRNEPMLTVPAFADASIDFKRGILQIDQTMPVKNVEQGVAGNYPAVEDNKGFISDTPLGLRLKTPNLNGKMLVIEPGFDIYPPEMVIAPEEKLSTQSAWIFQSLLDLENKGKLGGIKDVSIIPAVMTEETEKTFAEMFENLKEYGIDNVPWSIASGPDVKEGWG